MQFLGGNALAVVPHVKAGPGAIPLRGQGDVRGGSAVEHGVLHQIGQDLHDEDGVHGDQEQLVRHVDLHGHGGKPFSEFADRLVQDFLRSLRLLGDFGRFVADPGDGEQIFHHADEPLGVIPHIHQKGLLFGRGEQVRWQGRPAPFSLLEAEAKKQILLKWGLTVALGGGLLAVYLSGTEAPSMGFIGLVLLVAAVILISPVAERRNLMGEQYWITNQRAILMTRDKTFFYMELSDIDDLQVVGGTTKGKSLVLGRCLFEEAKKLLRWRACHPKVDVQSHDETDRALGMIFYGVQGAEAAAELLRQGRDGEAA